MKPLKSAGEIRGRKSGRHRVLWLRITVDENEHFLCWLVSNHKLSESSASAFNASSKDSEWLFESKELETWKRDPTAFFGYLVQVRNWPYTGFGSDTPMTPRSAGSEKKALC